MIFPANQYRNRTTIPMKMNLDNQIRTIIQDLTTPNPATSQIPFDVDFRAIPVAELSFDEINVKTYPQQRKLLWKLIVQYTGDPRLVDIAAKIIDSLNIPEREPMALATGFQQFVQQNIKFFRERPERFVNPVRTVQWGIGDCDDKTILLATLLRTFRIPVRLKFIRFVSPKSKKNVSHVYPQAKINNRWITLETVQQWPPGKDGETILKNKNIPTKVEYIGDKND